MRGGDDLPESALPRKRPSATAAQHVVMGESPGGIAPPGAPRSVHEPLDSHGSRCSAVSMAQLPMSEERWICAAKPIKPVACTRPITSLGCDISMHCLSGFG